jgi:hypothetical protein
MDVDRSTEQVTVSDVSIRNYTAVEDSVNVSCVITNTGPLSVEIVRLWVQDQPPTGTPNYNSSVTSIILQPGNSTTFSRSVKINGAKLSDEFTLWFVTARGNRIPFSPSQGTGDFVPDYRSVKWAQCTYTGGQYQVGPNWNNSRILPANSNVTWRIDVTYYGQESLTIANNSMLFFVPLARNGEPKNYASLTCYTVSYTNITQDTGYISSYGNEVPVTPSIGGYRVTLYFGSPNHSPGGVGGISSQDIADIGGGMMSLTIYGKSSNYAQSFPLFAVETEE